MKSRSLVGLTAVSCALAVVGEALADPQLTQWSGPDGGRFDMSANWNPEATFAAGSTHVVSGTDSFGITFGETTKTPVNVQLIRPLPTAGSSLLTLDLLGKVWTLPASGAAGITDYGEVPFAVATGEDIATTYALQLKQDRTAYAGSAPVMVSNATLTVENSSAGMRTVFVGRSGSRGLVNLFDASEDPVTTKTKALYVGRYADKSVLEFRDVDTVLPKVWLPPANKQAATIRFNGGTHALNGNVAFFSEANQDAGYRAADPTYPTFEVTNGANVTISGSFYMSEDDHGGYVGSRSVLRVCDGSTISAGSFFGGKGINRFEVLGGSTLTFRDKGSLDGNSAETNSFVVSESALNFYGDTKAGIGTGCEFGLFATNSTLSNRGGYAFSIEYGHGTVDLVNSSWDGGFFMLGSSSATRETVFSVRKGSSVHGDKKGGWALSLGIGIYQYSKASTAGTGSAKVLFEEGSTGTFDGTVWIGGQSGHTGTLQVDGGDVNLSEVGGSTLVGHYGSGVLDIRGGTVRVGADGLKIANQAVSSGQVLLSGGTFAPVSVGVGAGSAAMAVTGGTLRAPGDSEAWISGIGTATIGGAGLTVDTDGHTVVIPQAFTAAAGESAKITKVGDGLLTMTAADGDYDEIHVAGGTFRLGDGITAAGAVSVVSNATFSMAGRTADLTLSSLTVGTAATRGRLELSATASLIVTGASDLTFADVTIDGLSGEMTCTPLVVDGEMPKAVFEAIERSLVTSRADRTKSCRVERAYDSSAGRTAIRMEVAPKKDVGATLTWNGATDGDRTWGTDANWSSETAPTAVNVAAFPSASAATDILVGSGAEASGLVFDDNRAYALSGTDRMRIGDKTLEAAVEVRQGSATLDVPIAFGDSAAVSVAAESTLSFAKRIELGDVVKSGAGTLALNAQSVADPSVRIEEGSVAYGDDGDGVANGSWTLASGAGTATLDLASDLELKGGLLFESGTVKKTGAGTVSAATQGAWSGSVSIYDGGLAFGGAFSLTWLAIGVNETEETLRPSFALGNASLVIEKGVNVAGSLPTFVGQAKVRVKDSSVAYGTTKKISGSHEGPIWGGYADIEFDNSSLSLCGTAGNGAKVSFAPRFAMTARGRLAFVNGGSYSGRDLRFSYQGYENKGSVTASSEGLEFVFDGGTLHHNPPETAPITNRFLYAGDPTKLGRTVPRAANDKVTVGPNGMTVNVAASRTAFMRISCTGPGGFTKTGPGSFTFLPAASYVNVYGSISAFVPNNITNTINYAGVTRVAEGTLGVAKGAALPTAAFCVDAGATLDLRGEEQALGTIAGPGSVANGTLDNPTFAVTVSGGEVAGLPSFSGLSLAGKASIDFGGTLAAAELGKPLTIGSFSGCDLSGVSRWKAVNTGLEQGVSVRLTLKDGILEATPERRGLMIIVR